MSNEWPYENNQHRNVNSTPGPLSSIVLINSGLRNDGINQGENVHFFHCGMGENAR